MTEQLTADIWREIKRYINPSERGEAADTMLSVMIDHDCDIDDIRTAFAGDSIMKQALSAHLDASEEPEEEYDEDYDEEESEY
jgi:uncharacterized protein (UPF0305 family)